MNQISDLNKGKITHWCYSTTNEVAERLTDVGKNMRVSINNPQTTKKTRKNSMLANLDIKRWYDNTARGTISIRTKMDRDDQEIFIIKNLITLCT